MGYVLVYPEVISRGTELFNFIFDNGHMDRFKQLTEELVVCLEAVSLGAFIDHNESVIFI